MKTKKFIGFCLGLLFFGATLAFSQARILSSQEFGVVYFSVDSENYTQRVRSVTLVDYSDNTTQIAIYYRDGTETEYIYLRNPRHFGTRVEFDVSITDSFKRRTANLVGTMSNMDDGVLHIGITEKGSTSGLYLIALALKKMH